MNRETNDKENNEPPTGGLPSPTEIKSRSFLIGLSVPRNGVEPLRPLRGTGF
jgi:hypothetical protein